MTRSRWRCFVCVSSLSALPRKIPWRFFNLFLFLRFPDFPSGGVAGVQRTNESGGAQKDDSEAILRQEDTLRTGDHNRKGKTQGKQEATCEEVDG